VHEDRPRAVVDAPTVLIESDVRGLDDVNDALRDRWFAGRGILDGKEFLGSRKVVNGARIRIAVTR